MTESGFEVGAINFHQANQHWPVWCTYRTQSTTERPTRIDMQQLSSDNRDDCSQRVLSQSLQVKVFEVYQSASLEV